MRTFFKRNAVGAVIFEPQQIICELFGLDGSRGHNVLFLVVKIMGSKRYNPVFAEETFIVNLYGTSKEIEEFDLLIADDASSVSLTAMVDLVETIKRRRFTGMNWNCCHQCQSFLNCSVKKHRFRRNQPRECCSMCKQYKSCLSLFQAQQ